MKSQWVSEAEQTLLSPANLEGCSHSWQFPCSVAWGTGCLWQVGSAWQSPVPGPGSRLSNTYLLFFFASCLLGPRLHDLLLGWQTALLHWERAGQELAPLCCHPAPLLCYDDRPVPNVWLQASLARWVPVWLAPGFPLQAGERSAAC